MKIVTALESNSSLAPLFRYWSPLTILISGESVIYKIDLVLKKEEKKKQDYIRPAVLP